MPLPPISGVAPPASKEFCWFIGCDTHYVINHAIPLIYSIDDNAGGDVHLHIVNPTDGLENAVCAVSSMLKRTRLTVSIERVNLLKLSSEERITYYACIRFVRAVQVMLASKRAMLVVDADSIVRKPFEIDCEDIEAGLYLRADHPAHMGVAAGAVLFTPKGKAFAKSVANGIGQALDEALQGKRNIGWYLDQYVLTEAYKAQKPRTATFDPAFMDWEFHDESILWTGKGPRKHDNAAYVAEVKKYSERFTIENLRESFWSYVRGTRRTLLLRPRLSIPFKRTVGLVTMGAVPELRNHWAKLDASILHGTNAQEIGARLLCLPMWQYTPELVDAYGADVVLIPHKERHQFKCQTPALYYMQTPIPDRFTIDPEGWGAGCKDYPFTIDAEPPCGALTELRKRIGSNESKFDQPASQSKTELIDAGLIPDAPYVFFPCQIPHDETIRFHSDVAEVDVVRAVAEWAEAMRRQVVFKPHPVNLPSMVSLQEAAPASDYVRWSDASIHDLIKHSAAVFTINSGAGLEALIHGKPVMVFGRSEYDCLAVKCAGATVEDIREAYERLDTQARLGSSEANISRYFDWFMNEHTFDANNVDAKRLIEKINAVSPKAKAA